MKSVARWGLVLVTTGMLFVLLQLSFRLNELQWNYYLVRQDHKDYLQLDLRHAKLKRQVARAWDERQASREQLFDWLADCKSREDFIVREGPWIVASELRCERPQNMRVGFYLPHGEHVLKFAVKRSRADEPWTSQSQSAFFQHDTRRFSSVVVITLPATPQVFELQLETSLEEQLPSLTLNLLGINNTIFEQRTVRLPANSRDMTHYGASCLPKLNYPSELDLEHPNSEGFYRVGIPKTELLHLSTTGTREECLGVRIWIESSAPACLSAMKVAYYRDSITDMRLSYSALSSYQLDDLFEPYADSSRYRFRDNVFLSANELPIDTELN